MLLALSSEDPCVPVGYTGHHATLSVIVEARLHAPLLPIFLLIEVAKNRTISVVIQVYNISESTRIENTDLHISRKHTIIE